jgi:hypothetical protein
MPEIVAVGFVGAIVTFIAVNLNLYWVHRSFQSPVLKTLNHNLSKVGRYWSLEQGRLIEMPPSAQQEEFQKKDYQKSTRSAFLFGTMMIFLSWFGLFILAVYFLSTHKFAKSRLEQRIFASNLVSDENLSASEIENSLREMENLGR